MTEEERNLDFIISELEQENRLLRARNERLEKRELTDEEIEQCCFKADALEDDNSSWHWAVLFARFIIAKMKS